MTTNGKEKARPTKAIFSIEEMKLLRPILDQQLEIEELPVSVLQVDMSYQDRPRERIVNQVATHFSEALLGVLLIGQRTDGSYWVCDGESRRQGIVRRGDTHRTVRCLVFQSTGPKQEALVFAFSNSKRSKEPTKLITNLQAYNIAGTDQGFGKAVEECGFTLTKGRNQLHGPGYALRAWKLDGDGTAMKKSLYTLKDSWRGKYQVDGYMTLGVALLYHSQKRTVDEQVRRVLHRMSPTDLMDRVIKRWISAGGGKARIHPDDKPRLIAAMIAELINKNPGKAGRLDLDRLKHADEHVEA